MTQFDNPNPFAPTDGMTPPAERRTSGLAVTSFIMSIIFCCPLTTIPAFIMGLIALTKTGPQAAFKGRGLAIAAIIISLIGTGLQAYVGTQFYWGWTRMNEAPREVFTAVFNDDAPGVRQSMHQPGGAIVTDEEIADFRSTLEDRYGSYISSRYAFEPGRQTSSKFGATTQPFSYDIKFQNATVEATIEIVFADRSTSEKLGKVGTITIHDPDLGDLIFPLSPAGAAPSDPADSNPVDDPGAGP